MITVSIYRTVFKVPLTSIKHTSLEEINNMLSNIEQIFNFYIDKINSIKGENMINSLNLEKIDNIANLKDVLNKNIVEINLTLNKINEILTEDNIVISNVSTVENINYYTPYISGKIDILADKIKIKVNDKELTINKDGDIQ